MTGPETIFEGRYSIYHTHGISEQAIPEQVAQGLGEQWEFLNVSIKPYPVCDFAHATVDCGRRLLKRGISNPENPMVDTDVIAKFYDNAKCVMKKTQADQLIENIMNFENIPISLLTQLLRVEA